MVHISYLFSTVTYKFEFYVIIERIKLNKMTENYMLLSNTYSTIELGNGLIHALNSFFCGAICCGLACLVIGQSIYYDNDPMIKYKVLCILRSLAVTIILFEVFLATGFISFNEDRDYAIPILSHLVIFETFYTCWHWLQHKNRKIFYYTHSLHHSIGKPAPIDAYYLDTLDIGMVVLCISIPFQVVSISQAAHVGFLTIINIGAVMQHSSLWLHAGHLRHHSHPAEGRYTFLLGK